jgi:hypothetical protein
MANGDLVDVCEAIESYLNGLKDNLGIKRVWYGDDDLVPHTPTVAIIPEGKSRNLSDTGHMVQTQYDIGIMIYHSDLKAPNVTRKDCDKLAQVIEDALHDNKKIGGVIFGYVRSMEPGVTKRGSTMLRATRLLWRGISKERI